MSTKGHLMLFLLLIYAGMYGITFFLMKIGKKYKIIKYVDYTKEAIKRGNVVDAYYIEGSKEFYKIEDNNGLTYGDYEYVVDGKRYVKSKMRTEQTKWMMTTGVYKLQPKTLLLYLDDPAEAFQFYEHENKDWGYLIFRGIIFGITFLIFMTFIVIYTYM